jgi:hypothetical protein
VAHLVQDVFMRLLDVCLLRQPLPVACGGWAGSQASVTSLPVKSCFATAAQLVEALLASHCHVPSAVAHVVHLPLAYPDLNLNPNPWCLSVCRTNVGGVTSTGNNGFTVQVPPGITLPSNAVIPGPGSPAGTFLSVSLVMTAC